MKDKLFLLLFSFFIAACNTTKEQKQAEINIVFTENTSPIAQLNLLVNKRYIQLETTTECLFSEITQLSCTSKELFIFDIYTQSIYVFDYSGKFMRKLHKTGQGPGEYVMITSMVVNEKERQISVVNLGQNILSYDIDSFTFINDVKIEAVAIEKTEDSNFITYNSLSTTVGKTNYKYHVLKFNKNGEIEQKFLPIEFESGYTMRPIQRFYRSENELFVYLPFTPNIYKITQDTCIPFYNVEYENLSFPPLNNLESIDKQGDNYIKKLYTGDYIYFVQIFENKSFLTSQFCVGEKKYIGIYNKDKKEGRYYLKSEGGISKSIEEIDYLQIVGSNNEDFISVLKYDTENKSQNLDNELKQILSKRTNESNPILLLFNIRK